MYEEVIKVLNDHKKIIYNYSGIFETSYLIFYGANRTGKQIVLDLIGQTCIVNGLGLHTKGR